jgi:hypothetical protein
MDFVPTSEKSIVRHVLGAEKQIRSMHIFQHAYLVQLERIEKLRKLEAQMPVIMTLTQT